MNGARMSTLASLRGSIERMEAPGDVHALNKVALGHRAADAMLRGGLPLAAVHEVFAEGHQGAAATGFLAAIAGRISSRKPLVWVRQDFAEVESGALSPGGLCELGLDPRLLVTVRAADVEAALRTTADALACDALGAVVLETFGEARQFSVEALASTGAKSAGSLVVFGCLIGLSGPFSVAKSASDRSNPKLQLFPWTSTKDTCSIHSTPINPWAVRLT